MNLTVKFNRFYSKKLCLEKSFLYIGGDTHLIVGKKFKWGSMILNQMKIWK